MATSSESRALLLLLVSAASALLLLSSSPAVVDAVCVPRKLTTLKSVAVDKLPQTPASFKGPSSHALASLIASKAAQAVDHTVVDVCHRTDYPDICISSVRAHLKGTANPLSMLAAEIEDCTEKTKSAAAEVAKFAADASASPAEKMALSTCKENYGFARDSLTNAKKAIAAHDVGTLNSELSAVITFASTCDDAFVEMSVKSPLTGADRILQKLGSNCLAIAAQAHL